MTPTLIPELTESYGVPVYEDDRVPLWWNDGILIVPENVDPEPMLKALSGSQPDPTSN